MTEPELLDRLLIARGITDPDSKEQFLNPKYADMHDPLLMHDMEKSVERILCAIDAQEKICIYSDYDADGIPGAVVLHDFFKKIGYDHFCNYIPHRHTEGYGLHLDALDKIASEGSTLMITVDLGITAVAEVVYAKKLGLDVIITDHHEPLAVIPDAFAVVNPKLGNYPDRMLCGAGVAFKLVQGLMSALNKKQDKPSIMKPISEGWEKWLLDMAGLATLSDMVPLQHENRIIAYFGMKVLQKSKRPGLQALFQKSGISMRHLTEDDIVFSITPKLNAAGRMAHPEDAFKALATTDRNEGVIAGEYLSKLNDDRKKHVARVMKEVHKKIHARKAENNLKSILVIGDPLWPAGILGLVASKITESYNMTTFVWGAEGETIKGSCRGVGDVAVVELMQKTAHLLVQFGGHDDAGGFTTTRTQIHFLEDACNAVYDATKRGVVMTEKVPYDMELDLASVTMDHYHAIRHLAPFGVGNPKPIFAFRDVLVESVRQFGKTTEHLEMVVIQNGTTRRAICWYATPESFTEKIVAGTMVTLLATFDFSVFRGTEELRLKIVDVLH